MYKCIVVILLSFTIAYPGPPVWLLHGVVLNLWMLSQSMKQVCSSTLWLANKIKVRQAPQWNLVQLHLVPGVLIIDGCPSERHMPTRTLDFRKVFSRKFRDKLWKKKNDNVVRSFFTGQMAAVRTGLTWRY